MRIAIITDPYNDDATTVAGQTVEQRQAVVAAAWANALILAGNNRTDSTGEEETAEETPAAGETPAVEETPAGEEETPAEEEAAEPILYAPPGEVEMDTDVEVQESKPIGAAHRRLFMRGNRGINLSFKVRPKFATLAEAEAAQIAILARVGTAGQLVMLPGNATDIGDAGFVYPDEVYPAPAEEGVTPVRRFTGNREAVIKRIRAKQIGVTVEAHYEIAF